MELKVQCDCGQKFKFDVEPVNGAMPFTVNCPTCGVDRTQAANALLANIAAPPLAAAVPVAPRLQINRPAPAAAATVMAQPPPVARALPAAAAMPRPKAAGEFNMGLGILGALLGAGLGAGLMYGFFVLAGFRFPLLGVGIGVLTGYGAKLLFKGTDSVLGMISGTIALIAVVGTLYLMYGEFPIVSIISVVVSVSVAYRISSG